MQGSFDDRQGLIQVDQHNRNIWQVLWVTLLQTPIQKQRDFLKLTKELSFSSVRCLNASSKDKPGYTRQTMNWVYKEQSLTFLCVLSGMTGITLQELRGNDESCTLVPWYLEELDLEEGDRWEKHYIHSPETKPVPLFGPPQTGSPPTPWTGQIWGTVYWTFSLREPPFGPGSLLSALAAFWLALLLPLQFFSVCLCPLWAVSGWHPAFSQKLWVRCLVKGWRGESKMSWRHDFLFVFFGRKY